MLAGFTNWKSLGLCMYMMKAVHRKLPVTVRKKLYDKDYSGVLCLLCGKIELLDHVFICACNVFVHDGILTETTTCWTSLSKVWLVRSKYRADMKRASLVKNGGLILGLSHGVSFLLSDSMVKLFGIIESFVVSFGHRKSCLFFSGLDCNMQVMLDI
ncbi:hypothetical protein G9A89_017366 [Geosiphon pyriformis]|nr:hypothetical protein G9A89_017366 [Geosiphon pyriformis]